MKSYRPCSTAGAGRPGPLVTLPPPRIHLSITSGSISVTGGSFATAELEDFIDPDRTIILTLELGEGAAGAAAMAATSGAAVGTLPTPERSGTACSNRSAPTGSCSRPRS